MESAWGQQELMFAFQQAVEDKRLRVILIIKGDIEEIRRLAEGCPLILAYLKTHTYIEWKDRWFWNKLKYALPHKEPEKCQRKSFTHEDFKLKELS